MTETELYHYGIKGQKWGVRRYQNPDGTRTPLGKRRRYDNIDGTITDAGKKYYAKKASEIFNDPFNDTADEFFNAWTTPSDAANKLTNSLSESEKRIAAINEIIGEDYYDYERCFEDVSKILQKDYPGEKFDTAVHKFERDKNINSDKRDYKLELADPAIQRGLEESRRKLGFDIASVINDIDSAIDEYADYVADKVIGDFNPSAIDDAKTFMKESAFMGKRYSPNFVESEFMHYWTNEAGVRLAYAEEYYDKLLGVY